MEKEQCLLSVAHFMHEAGKTANADLKPVFNEMPAGMSNPAIYFPNPVVVPFPGTLSSTRLNYSLFVKVIAEDTETAYKIAAAIQRVVCKHKCLIPILEQDNSESGNYIRTEKPQIKEIDRRTYQIQIGWNETVPNNGVDSSATGGISEIGCMITHKSE